ncbi:hypothetical protein JTE90_011042 [Oedothorax gibbosus]|uniref:Uncharacterized protein n=1 Tax=Oedothorax gibbosus TaxID=931172 RepID=A0AAV6VFN8_9ARAC|nr:hypothetical protein JTE90_011042 [Oedothorax gibbosus]
MVNRPLVFSKTVAKVMGVSILSRETTGWLGGPEMGGSGKIKKPTPWALSTVARGLSTHVPLHFSGNFTHAHYSWRTETSHARAAFSTRDACSHHEATKRGKASQWARSRGRNPLPRTSFLIRTRGNYTRGGSAALFRDILAKGKYCPK